MDKIEFGKYLGNCKYREDGMTLDIPYEKFRECIEKVAKNCDYETVYLIMMAIAPSRVAWIPIENLCDDFVSEAQTNIESKVYEGKKKKEAFDAYVEKQWERKRKRAEYQREYRRRKRGKLAK